MENIRLKVLAGFKAGKSASHLSKIYALSLDQVLEWKRLLADSNIWATTVK